MMALAAGLAVNRGGTVDDDTQFSHPYGRWWYRPARVARDRGGRARIAARRSEPRQRSKGGR
jgi:hypothetical protein